MNIETSPSEDIAYGDTCGLPFEDGKWYRVTYLAKYINTPENPNSLFAGGLSNIARTYDDYWGMTNYIESITEVDVADDDEVEG